jgi:hypothetical protein
MRYIFFRRPFSFYERRQFDFLCHFDEEKISKDFAFYKNNYYFERLLQKPHQNSVPASFPVIGRFSPVFTPYWGMQEKSAKMRMSLAEFRTIFRVTGGFRNNC